MKKIKWMSLKRKQDVSHTKQSFGKLQNNFNPIQYNKF